MAGLDSDALTMVHPPIHIRHFARVTQKFNASPSYLAFSSTNLLPTMALAFARRAAIKSSGIGRSGVRFAST